MIKFCKDCKWFSAGVGPGYEKCVSPSNPGATNLVTGEEVKVLDFCSLLRACGDSSRYCGPEGTWFEPKDAP